jgi:uncharacterized lipoprotein NlpE involved in copper resistance
MTKKILSAVTLTCLVVSASLGCGCGAKLESLPDTAKEIVRDCGKEDAPALSRLVLDFLGAVALYVLAGEKIDWLGIEAKAEHEGTVVAQCAFVEVVDRFRNAQAVASRAATAEKAAETVSDANQAVEKLRAATGGSRWRLISGAVR